MAKIKTVNLDGTNDAWGENYVPKDVRFKGVIGKYISNGAFGTVYTHPKSRKLVVKVIEGEDEAYMDFVIAAINAKGNPWFPRIKSVTLYKEDGLTEYTVVVMEKLRDGNYCKKKDWCDVFLRPYYSETKAGEINMLHRELNAMGKKKSKYAVATYRMLKRLFSKHEEDLHSGNLMFRGKQPVIIDPIC